MSRLESAEEAAYAAAMIRQSLGLPADPPDDALTAAMTFFPTLSPLAAIDYTTQGFLDTARKWERDPELFEARLREARR